MDNVKKIDILDRIKRFQEDILEKKPSFEDMVSDVNMMNFKIRPVAGNIADLDYANIDFIDALWSLGKLDDFFKAESNKIDKTEKDTFFRMVNSLRINFQNKLKRANIHDDEKEKPGLMQFFEIEIIKDNNLRVH